MFHIPFEKNYLIKNERFSISGFPSFYLGKSVYVCWEEMGRPDFDQANVAVFTNHDDCTVIDLCMPMQSKDTIDSLFILPMIVVWENPHKAKSVCKFTKSFRFQILFTRFSTKKTQNCL